MTGIFHIFYRTHGFTGSRCYGSKRVSNTAGQLQSVSACETPRHDHSNPNWTFEEDNAAQNSVDNSQPMAAAAAAAMDWSKGHHRAYSDNSDLFTKTFEAPVLADMDSTDPNFDGQEVPELEDLPLCKPQEKSVTVDDLDQSSVPLQKEYQKPNLLVSSRETASELSVNSKDLQKLPGSSDIRDIVRASFHKQRRTKDSSPGKEKLGASVHLGYGSVQSKSLQRSSSVNGGDGFWISDEGREEAYSSVNLPRSSSVDARQGSRMLGDWKTPLLHSIVESPQIAIRGKDLSKSWVDGRDLPRTSVDRMFTKCSSPIDRKYVMRLMVELQEDPRLSVPKDDHQGLKDRRDVPKLLPGPNTQHPESKSLTTFDCRASFQAPDANNLLRTSQRVQDRPRFSLEGPKDPSHTTSVSPRISVDGQDSPRGACGMTTTPRSKLDDRNSMRHAGKLSADGGGASQLKKENAAERDDGQGETYRWIPNVVARLMGLEELPGIANASSHRHPAKLQETNPSTRETRLMKGFSQYTPLTVSPPPPPSPRQSDDYNYKQQVRKEGFQQLRQCPPVQSLDVRLSFKSSSPGSNEKEVMSLLHSPHQLLYYDGEEVPFQYQPEESLWTHSEDKSGDHTEVKSHLPSSHHLIAHGVPPVFTQQDAHKDLQEQLSQSPAQLSDVVNVTILKHADDEKKQLRSSQEPLFSLEDQQMQQLQVKSSVQGRKLLRHILQAMQLKGLLRTSRRKRSQDTKMSLQVPTTIVEGSKSQMQAFKLQVLPSTKLRLTVSKQKNPRAEYIKDLPMIETKMHKDLRVLEIQQTNSRSFEPDDEPIMLGNIPETLIIIPKPMDADPITDMMMLSSSPPAQPEDLGSISSRSGSSGTSVDTSSVQTVNGKSSQVQAQTSSGVLHEPNASSNCSGMERMTTPRRSRKERTIVQGSLDVSRGGQDVSPRSLALVPFAQGKHSRLSFPTKEANPLKLGSPDRCMTSGSWGSSHLVENGKAWSKPLMVKDREESQTTRLTLRTTQSTKQDFLKGRTSSGGSDTPRGCRSSSDSKLISRISEKLTATESAAAMSSNKAQGGKDPSEVPILRSKKRLTGKSSNPAPKSRTSLQPEDTETQHAATSTKEKSKFQNGITGSVTATEKHPDGEESNDVTKLMIESIQENGTVETTSLDLPTALTALPENLVTENISVRKASRVRGTEELESDVIQKPGVRITEGEAVDHSEDRDDPHAFTGSQITSPIQKLLQSEQQQQDAELDEREIAELLTPRGVSVRKQESPDEFLPAEVIDQPSPVSVLDNFEFPEEEPTPSPRTSKTSSIDSLEQDAIDSPHREHLEEVSAALKGLADIIGCGRDFNNNNYLHLNKQSAEIQLPIDTAPETNYSYNSIIHGICLWNKDDEKEFVRDVLAASGILTEDTSSFNYLHQTDDSYIMHPSQFDVLELRHGHWQPFNTKENDDFLFERCRSYSGQEAVGRRVLFDGMNEILVQKLDPVKFSPLPWIGGERHELQEKPAGQQLVQEVWDELQDVPCVASENVCDTLNTILLKDVRNSAKQWSCMDGELSEISLEVERMIVKGLIDEIVKDLSSGFSSSSSCNLSTQPIDAATKRQLFAY